MSRAKQKYKGQFVMLTDRLLKDPKWRELSDSAKIIWIYLRRKFNYETFNEVTLTYSEMKDMFSPATMSKAFKQLQKIGFIEKVRPGGLFGGASVYKFMGEHKDFYWKGHKI